MSLKCILVGSAAVLVLAIFAGPRLIAADAAVADSAMVGDTAAIRALLAQHADINAPQADGATALHWSVYRNDFALAKLLIEAGANVRAANRDGATPLSLAATTGNAEMIATLLGAGASPNEKLPFGQTALMLAARNGNPAALKALLDHGADVNAKEDLRGTTPLMWAADEAHPDAVKLLIDRGADVKARSAAAARGRGPALGKAGDPRKQQARGAVQADAAAGGQGQAAAAQTQFDREGPADGGQLTALVYAARTNDLESVKILLAAGADVNQTTGYGWSPLLVATQNRHYKLAAYLLDHGANPDLANNGGWTPLYLATDNRNIENGDYPVRKADMDHLDFIKLLLDKGVDVNNRVKDSTETRTVFTNQWLDERGATAFLRASQSGDLVLMKALLAHGADPRILLN